MQTNDIISYVAYKYWETTRRYISKTKLIKILYIIDLFHYRKENNQLTEIEWVYYKFGPYAFDYDDRLRASKVETLEEDKEENHDAVLIKPLDDQAIYEQLQEKISFDAKTLVRNVLSDFSKYELSEILEYIYFETEPMLNASCRGEKLDFRYCRPGRDYKTVNFEIDRDLLRSIKNKYKSEIQNATKL